MTDKVYSVGEINAYIKNMFSQDFFLRHVYVKGEVSNCKYHSAGHIYFTLKDETGVIQAVMFYGSRKSGLKFPMKTGDKVTVLGRIGVYERDGKYQLYADEIQPEGQGPIYEKYLKLKKQLEEMGMFSAEYKQPIPAYARRVGVITSPTGAAVRDIQSVSRKRNPYVQLILYPAAVQGDAAVSSIVSGIRALERKNVDVIILGRGGGSMEDLLAFNEEIVARTIFDCRVPIISAAGHETDFTIADFVADLRVATPTEAAVKAVYDIREILNRLESVKYTLNKHMSYSLEQTEGRIRRYQLRLEVSNPKNKLLENRQRAADIQDGLQSRMERILTDRRHRLQLIAAALDGVSPLKKLESGYACLSGDDGKKIISVGDIAPGDHIRAWMSDGNFSATVDDISPAAQGE